MADRWGRDGSARTQGGQLFAAGWGLYHGAVIDLYRGVSTATTECGGLHGLSGALATATGRSDRAR